MVVILVNTNDCGSYDFGYGQVNQPCQAIIEKILDEV